MQRGDRSHPCEAGEGCGGGKRFRPVVSRDADDLIMQFLLNHRFVAEEDARISVSDRGFLYGDAAFDTLCAYGGRVFRASVHLQRLMLSLSALRIEPPCTLAQMEDD